VTLWIMYGLNGLCFGMLLFVLAAGLSLIFGIMHVINLAHGSLYMVGAYFGVFLAAYTGNFLLAVIGGSVSTAILGMIVHRFLLRRFSGNILAQVLLTLGLLFILSDIALWIWGGEPLLIDKPAFFNGVISIGEVSFPIYRLLIMVVGVLIGGFLWWFQEGTKYGAIIRAGVDDREMVETIGINIPLVMTLVFGLGAILAGVAGVLGGPMIGAYPGVDFDVLLLSIAVVIIGGLGSLRGALVGALIVGFMDSIGKGLFPEISLFILFAVTVAVLAVRPGGLFGRT